MGVPGGGRGDDGMPPGIGIDTLLPAWRLLGVVAAGAQPLAVRGTGRPALGYRGDVVEVAHGCVAVRGAAQSLVAHPQQPGQSGRKGPSARVHRDEDPAGVRVQAPHPRPELARLTPSGSGAATRSDGSGKVMVTAAGGATRIDAACGRVV